MLLQGGVILSPGEILFIPEDDKISLGKVQALRRPVNPQALLQPRSKLPILPRVADEGIVEEGLGV